MSLQTQKDELERMNASHVLHIAVHIPTLDTRLLYKKFLTLCVSYLEERVDIKKHEQALRNLFHIVYLKISIGYILSDVDKDDSTVLVELVNIISNDFNRDVADIFSIEEEYTVDLTWDMVIYLEELITPDKLKVLQGILLDITNIKIGDVYYIVPLYVLHRDDRNGDRAFARFSLVTV